jgi:ubiquinone/menaquinone biosynthesis C-methylase UbiE
MNTIQQNEFNFWQSLIGGMSWDEYMAHRKRDLDYHLTGFNGHCDLSVGDGMEIGTGAFSMLEFVEGDNFMLGVDPLAEEYKQLLQKQNERIHVAPVHTEILPYKDDSFDWIVCWNVIDHTPYPDLMIDEIKRVLRPGGKLYLQVQFDAELVEACHYSVWRRNDIEERVRPAFSSVIFEDIIPRPEFNQDMYYGVFIK